MISGWLITLNWFAIAALVLARLRRMRFNVLDPAWTFLGGYAVNYCLRPALYAFDPEVGGIYQDYIYPEALIRHGANGALVLSLIGLLGFALGDRLFERAAKSASRRLPTLPLERVAASRPYGLAALLFFLLGVAGLYGFVKTAGWTGTLLELLSGGQRDAFMQVILGHGYFTLAMQLSIVGWALICVRWVGMQHLRTGIGRTLHHAFQVSWLIGTLMIWVAFGERVAILTVLFLPLAFRFTLRALATTDEERRKGRRAILLALATVVCCSAIAGPVGLLMKGKEVNPTGAVGMAISAWDSFEFTVAAKHYVHLSDLRWGTTYFGDLVYTWLPRTVFPWKPERYGAVVVQDIIAPDLKDNVGATFPTGFLVEAYVNLWYAGVFLVPLVLAIVFRVWYYRIEAKDWFWLVQVALLFPTLASFRSVGWAAATLLANVCVVGIVVLSCCAAVRLNRAIRNLPLQPRSYYEGAQT